MSAAVVPTHIVDVRVGDDLVVATLDDGKVNALGFSLVRELRAALRVAVERRRPLVLAGRPGVFSAGFDLAVVDGPDEDLVDDLLDETRALVLALLDAPVPVVAACTGHAIAGGAVLLLAADHRIGTEGDARIGLNEVTLGRALPDFALTLASDRLDPRRRARATVLGVATAPAEAVEVGFLHELREDPVAAAIEVARGLSRLPATPLATTRRLAHAPLLAALAGQSLRVPREDPW